MNASAPACIRPVPDALPVLHLSGPALRTALGSLLAAAEDTGGVDAYVQGLSFKVALFRSLLTAEHLRTLTEKEFLALCTFMPTVRRRIGAWLVEHTYPVLHQRLGALFGAPGDVEGRFSDFIACFPDDRAHRWVRDLGAELLHFTSPDDVPLMTRWIWDARTATGVLREIWHDEDDSIRGPSVTDRLPTFFALRTELTGFLRDQGFFRDLPLFQDLLCAHIYAGYINDRGSSYMSGDFAEGEDAMVHTRRLLGLDSLEGPQVRMRVKLSFATRSPSVTLPRREREGPPDANS
jgi:hypothetical protein